MRMTPLCIAIAVATLSWTPGIGAEPATAPAAATVDKDSARTTPAGVQFTVPAGWSAITEGNRVTLAPPEPDFQIVLVDVAAKDADQAVAEAWKGVRPDFKRALRIAQPLAPRDGWEERRLFNYETSPNEKRVVQASAWRAGKAWTVVLVEGSAATAEKRGGPTGIVFGSIRPKGYSPETFAGRKAHKLDADRIAALRRFMEDGMKRLDVPGVGYSLIENGKLVYVGGGVRRVGHAEPVDADTLFPAASNTKALTTLLLADLVDDGKLRWDQPVVDVYPAFKLGDEATTKKVLVRHLVCACTGMPRQDLEWIFQYNGSTPATALTLLGGMQPTSAFGEVFQYSNLMVAAAGFVGGAIEHPTLELGAAYDLAMQERVFTPLGMTRTTFDFAKAMQGNWARPHDVDFDGKVVEASIGLNYAVVPARPAGGAWTSARELSYYVMMELRNGKLPDGKRLVSEQNLLQRRVANVPVGDRIDYGMGLTVDRRTGTPVVRHGGDLAGYHSDMIWLPEHDVGAVILTNGDAGAALRGPFARKLQEVLFDGKSEADAALDTSVRQIEAGRKLARERLSMPPDPAAADALAARYENAALGEVRIRRDGKAVHFDVGEWQSPMATRRNDDGTTSFVSTGATIQGFEFVVGAKDGKRTLVVRDAQHEYVFLESADAAGKAGS